MQSAKLPEQELVLVAWDLLGSFSSTATPYYIQVFYHFKFGPRLRKLQFLADTTITSTLILDQFIYLFIYAMHDTKMLKECYAQ